MKTPSALGLRSCVAPRGLWPNGRVLDHWMDAARSHVFVLFDTGWVVSIDARSGARTCSWLLDAFANDPIQYGTFFGDDRCKLFVVSNKWQRYLFELDPELPPRLAQRPLVATSGGVSMRASLDLRRLVVRNTERAWVIVASTLELEDAAEYPPELREWSGLLVGGDNREFVHCDASGVRVLRRDSEPRQCVRLAPRGVTDLHRTSATTLLATQRAMTGKLTAAWHVDLARRTSKDLVAMGLSQITAALACDDTLAISEDNAKITLVDLQRGRIEAHARVGPHSLVAMDRDCVYLLREAALSRLDLRDGSVTDTGGNSVEENGAIPSIASILVTDRGELVTVNAAGRRCAYDSDGALVAELHEPLARDEHVSLISASDGDAFVFEQKELASRDRVITKRSLAPRDLLQEVCRSTLPRGNVVHGCTQDGRVMFSYLASTATLSLSSADLSKHESVVAAPGTVTAWSTNETSIRLLCVAPDTFDGDGNPMGPPPPEFLLYIDARVSGPFPMPTPTEIVAPFVVYEGALGERFLRVSQTLQGRRVFATALTADASLGCVVTDQDELLFFRAEERSISTFSYKGWLLTGEFVTGCRFSTRAKHLALASSLGRVFVATLEQSSDCEG